MKQRSTSDFQRQRNGSSSGNIFNNSTNKSPMEAAYSRDDSKSGQSYQSLFTKEMKIGVCQQQSALPPSDKEYSFLALFPFIIFSVLKQVHVVYLIVLSAFLLYKYCDFQWKMLILQLCLTLGYIIIQIVDRYFTFKFYTKPHYFNNANYFYWDDKKKTWTPMDEKDIKVGQIIKIKLKNTLNSAMLIDYPQQKQQLKIQSPINILPLKLFSGSNQVSISTFETDKQGAEINIPIITLFQKYFQATNKKTHEYIVNQKISQQCTIRYMLSNPISRTFEAQISFSVQKVENQISNEDTIPRGAYFCNEKQLVGVALFNLQQQNIKYLKFILCSRNSMSTLLQKHLLTIICFNTVIALLLIGLDGLVTKLQIDQVFQNQYKCYFFDNFALLSFSMNVVMYIILGLHQIIDSFLIRRKCNVHMNNYIKSADEFGLADTFVLDQYAFMKKNILKVISIQLNQQQMPNKFDEQTILIIVQKSPEFQQRFQMQWASIQEYYRSKYKRGNLQTQHAITILDQQIDMSGSIRITISIEDKQPLKYTLRFNQKFIFSVLQSINIQKQLKFSDQILKAKQDGQLMLMVEIMQLKTKSDHQQKHQTLKKLQTQFKFLSLIRFQFTPHHQAVNFLKYLKHKYKIIIMCSNPFQYFEKTLVSAGLKKTNDHIIIIQETQESNFQKQLAHKFDQYKRNKFKDVDNQQREMRGNYYYLDSNIINSNKNNINIHKTFEGNIDYRNHEELHSGDLIVALHSSLFFYINQRKFRELLQQLSKISIYIIFYQCSQFEKELCAASVFKIFPQHIFLSNFAVDENIFRISNLSVCMQMHSAQRYATATAPSFQSLEKFISKQCVTSIELTTIIIKTHIFKNQCLIWSMISSMLFTYQVHNSLVSLEYSTFIMYFYNVFFTILPTCYYLIARPQLLGDIMVEDYKDYKLRYEHFKGIFSGILITFITFSMTPQSEITHVFIAVLVNCTFMANFYHLVIDDSVQKRYQIIIIILQCLISIGTYFLTLNVQSMNTLFYINWDYSPDSRYLALYFCTVFLLNPFIVLILFLFMSFQRSILVKDRRIQRKQLQYQEMKSSIKQQERIGIVGKTRGKQMKFRGADVRPEFY